MSSTETPHQFSSDLDVMQRALLIAQQGRGHVEPNPMVGAVIVDEQRRWIAEGYHQQFGAAHAEIHAITAAGDRCRGADLFVTLEPCSHFGKTPPCADAVIQAGFRRVVIGCSDPAAHVAGQGISRVQNAGLPVVVGVCQQEAERLIAPFRMLQLNQRPWVHAKWAMTLDGRIATSSGHSKWISCEESRRVVHQLRAQMDVIITGAGTVRADDPLLTARPPGARTPCRVVLDPRATALTPASRLCQSIAEAPVLVFTSQHAAADALQRLQDLGAEIVVAPETVCVALERDSTGERYRIDPAFVLQILGQRGFTNVLLEAGPGLLGTFSDSQLIDEFHVFIAPKLVGGMSAVPAVGGTGLNMIPELPSLTNFRWRASGMDLLLQADALRDTDFP